MFKFWFKRELNDKTNSDCWDDIPSDSIYTTFKKFHINFDKQMEYFYKIGPIDEKSFEEQMYLDAILGTLINSSTTRDLQITNSYIEQAYILFVEYIKKHLVSHEQPFEKLDVKAMFFDYTKRMFEENKEHFEEKIGEGTPDYIINSVRSFLNIYRYRKYKINKIKKFILEENKNEH